MINAKLFLEWFVFEILEIRFSFLFSISNRKDPVEFIFK